MKVKYKLTVGYLLVAILITLSGIFGLYGTERIIRLLEGRDEQVRSVFMLASKLSVGVKDAENDVVMCLVLGDKVLKRDYVNHIKELKNTVTMLDQRVTIPGGKDIVSVIKSELERVASSGHTLLEAFDTDVENKGSFVASEYADLISAFTTSTSNLRRYGLKLAELETDYLNRQEPITASLDLVSYAKRLQAHLMGYFLLHDEVDRKKVLDRYQAMKDAISALEKRLNDPSAQQILNHVMIDMEQLRPEVEKLVAPRVTEFRDKSPALYNADSIRKVSTLTDSIRDRGMALAQISVDLEIEPKKAAVERARFIQFIIIGVTVVPVLLAFILGYAANKTANELDESRIRLIQTNDELKITNERLRIEILEHQRSEEEKAGLITNLQDALAQVKALSGLIPICSSCKKIRDDKGYWHQVETYVRDHSEAEFSHSICPDCIRKLYPDLADSILGSREEKNV